MVVFRERPGRDSPSLVNTVAWSDINRSTVGSSSTSVSDLRVIDKQVCGRHDVLVA